MKKLQTVFQITKQLTRKVALDVAVSNTSKCLTCEATCCQCETQGHYQCMCRSVTNLATIRTDTVNEEPLIPRHNRDNTYAQQG